MKKTNIKDFFFSEALDTLEVGHVLGGSSCATGTTTCSTAGGNDSDGPGGDSDVPPRQQAPITVAQN